MFFINTFQENHSLVMNEISKYKYIKRETSDYFNLFMTEYKNSKKAFLVINDDITHCFSIPQKDIETVLKISNTREFNTYVCPNTFSNIKRVKEGIFNLTALFVDIDCHSQVVTDCMIEGLLYILENNYFNSKVPNPTMIVDSGRGIQLYWKIETAPKQAILYWDWVEKKLISALESIKENTAFQVDTQTRDCTRVLRIPGSYNLKAHKEVRILDIKPNNIYTLDEIKNEYLEYETFKTVHKNNNLKVCKNNYFVLGFNEKTYATSILSDFEKLVEIRKGDMLGYREKLLWLYRMHCLTLYSYSETNQKVYDLNSCFVEPLDQKEIDRCTVFRKGYKYKTATLINEFNITLKEQKEMCLLIGKDEKYKRNNESRNQKRYGREKGSNLTSKQRKRQEDINLSKKLKKEGKTIKEIAEILGKSKRTVERYLVL